MVSPEQRLRSLNITLPPAPKPAGLYRPAIQVGNMLYISGQGPRDSKGHFLTGKLGDGLEKNDGYRAASNTALQLLAVVKEVMGDLSCIDSVVKIVGMVHATEDFKDHASVLDGCSELLVNVLGERGHHSRSVMGVSSLTFDMILQVDAVFALKTSH